MCVSVYVACVRAHMSVVCVCVSLCVPLWLVITTCEMKPKLLVKQVTLLSGFYAEYCFGVDGPLIIVIIIIIIINLKGTQKAKPVQGGPLNI